MIVSFFLLFHYILDVLKYRLGKRREDENDGISYRLKRMVFDGEADVSETHVQFFPPAYLQRYQAVLDVLNLYKEAGSIGKVVEFGCAELRFFNYIKSLVEVEDYMGVDIDVELLKRSYSRVIPLTTDYLNKRSAPLRVQVLAGSVVHSDRRTLQANVIIAIELIEHLYPEEVIDLPYNIFGVVQPDLAIFTTPNSEFNVLFPNMIGFRHPDHKFEWSRDQFGSWCENVCLQYPAYEFCLHEIGRGPAWSRHLGSCSQMALFLRKERTLPPSLSPDQFDSISEVYECVYEVDYPFQTLEDKLLEDFEYQFYHFLNDLSKTEDFLVGGGELSARREIPLQTLLASFQLDLTTDRLIKFLKENTEYEVELVNNSPHLILPYHLFDETSSSLESAAPSSDDNYFLEGSERRRRERVADAVDEEDCWELDSSTHQLPPFDDRLRDENMMREEDGSEELDWDLALPESASQAPLASSAQQSVNEVNAELAKSNGLESREQPCCEVATPSSLPLKQINNVSVTSRGAIPKEESSRHSLNSSDTEEDRATPSVAVLRCPEELDLHQSESMSHSVSSPQQHHSHDKFIQRITSFSSLRNDPSKELFATVSLNSTQNFLSNDTRSFPSKPGTSGVDKCFKCSKFYFGQHFCRDTKTENGSRKSNNCDYLSVDKKEVDGTSPVHRSHSLGNVQIMNTKSKNFRYSLNIDNKNPDCDTSMVDMELELGCNKSSIPSLSDTFASLSKAVDSGYPNSVLDMELDLTPEQVGEILTETESSLDEEEEESEEVEERFQHRRQQQEQQGAGNNLPMVVFLEEGGMENGDVANNNRDGEGNNMEGGAGEDLGFEGLVLQQDGGVDGEAAAPGGQQDASDDDEGVVLQQEGGEDVVRVHQDISDDEGLVLQPDGADDCEVAAPEGQQNASDDDGGMVPQQGGAEDGEVAAGGVQDASDDDGLVLLQNGGNYGDAGGQLDASDDGLYVSALDVSSTTLIPEESSSCNDESIFNSIFEAGPSSPSSSLILRTHGSVSLDVEESQNDFPSWLRGLLLWEEEPEEGGDSGIGVDSGSSGELLQQEVIVPVDSAGGGDSTQ